MRTNFRGGLCIILSIVFFNINQPIAHASQSHNRVEIISTMDMVNAMDRKATEKELATLLKTEEAASLIASNGFSVNQIDSKLASLSDAEIQSLQKNMNQAKAGGILVTVVLVLLIIYLAQKI